MHSNQWSAPTQKSRLERGRCRKKDAHPRGMCVIGVLLETPGAHPDGERWMEASLPRAVLPSHLDYYLDEFTFRFNRRTSRSRGKLFYRLVQQAMMLDPVPARLISSGTRKS